MSICREVVSYADSETNKYQVDCGQDRKRRELTDEQPASKYFGQSSFQIISGDSRKIVKTLPQVYTVVTSPPYWGQRRYGSSQKDIGSEEGAESYLTELCDLLDATPLHPRGSVWVNLGDKRGSDGGLLNLPSRFSIEMQKRGWLLLDSVVWAKVVDLVDGSTIGNAMPEPAPNRLNGNGYELFFRFARSREAWADACAVRIPRAGLEASPYLPSDLMRVGTAINGRAAHNVWQIPMGQTRESHFAAYPVELVERPIAMSCPPFVNLDGSLPTRIVEMVPYDEGRGRSRKIGKYTSGTKQSSGRQDCGRQYVAKYPTSTGWNNIQKGWTPGIVLDPFCGTGTTGEVALKLGRRFIGIDLYEKYADIARERCENTVQYLQNRKEAHHVNPAA